LILGLFLLGRFKRPVPGWAATVGLLCGFLAVFSVWLPSVVAEPILAWPWFALIGSSVTVLVALLLSRLTDGRPATPANGSPQPELHPAG
jgi:solute:Na+ symporter, SSS family